MRTHAGQRRAVRSGASWQGELDALHATYVAEGKAVLVRTYPEMRVIGQGPRPGSLVVVPVAKGPVDYVGWVQTRNGPIPLALEAKSTRDLEWCRDDLAPHQQAFLQTFNVNSTIAALLLKLGDGSRWVLPWRRIFWDEVVDVGVCLRKGGAFDASGWLNPLLLLEVP